MTSSSQNPYQSGSGTSGPQPGWLLQLEKDVTYAQVMGAISVVTGVACSFVGFAFAWLSYRTAHAASAALARRHVRGSDLGKRASFAETLAIVGIGVSSLNLIATTLIGIYWRA